MPGMLDTILNLGLNDDTVVGLAERSGSERFAWDSYRRFVQMYGNVVAGVPGERFESAIADAKSARGVRLDTELDADALRELTYAFQGFYDFPPDPREQLTRAIRAVFDSWQGERAVTYRRLNRIPDDWGTAVNVQADGVRESRREQRQRRRLLARRGDGRARALGRLPDQRAGRGRRLRRAHAARHQRAAGAGFRMSTSS